MNLPSTNTVPFAFPTLEGITRSPDIAIWEAINALRAELKGLREEMLVLLEDQPIKRGG
jgi:hypothetical protein